MKKRSLFAAVAMLIVSAMVLTSATYAWFASGSTANVQEIKASVSNSDGTLLIATIPTGNNANWGTTLPYTAFQGISGLVGQNQTDSTTTPPTQLATALTPISFALNDTGMPMVSGGISQDSTDPTVFNFTSDGSAPSGGFIHLTFYVKATKACTVTVNPTFQSQKDFIYAAVMCNSAATGAVTKQVLGTTTANGYTPVKKLSASAVDANRNDIVDNPSGGTVEDTAGDILGTPVAKTTNNVSFPISATEADAGSYVTVEIYIWAEGQDPSCTGSVSTSTAGLTLELTKTI